MDHRRRFCRRTALLAFVALAVLAFSASASQARVVVSRSTLSAPTFAGYSTGVFRWSAVRKADHYEFELANDKGFNSSVLGSAGNFSTWSTSATLPVTVQDGTYWWRVRAVRKNGKTSKWITRSFTKAWQATTTLLSPADNASISFPTHPLLLSWKPVLGAVRYDVAIARDPKMTSLVDGAQTETTATSYVPPSTLPDGKYYWTVTPVDAEKHQGKSSVVRSFSWSWPTETTWATQNLMTQNSTDALQLFDPLLSWGAVPGAAKYELDINFSQDFNSSSRVCCSSTTVATGYSPPKPFPNNTYFWRVRPINADGALGNWSPGQSDPTAATFTQYFDTIPPIAQNGLTISGLHVRDDALVDSGDKPHGWATSDPILVWDPVAGASEYQLDIYTMSAGNVCDLQTASQDISLTTPLTVWSPLGSGHGDLPYPSTGTSLESGGGTLQASQHYCVRIRAVGEASTTGGRVYGDYTFLDNAFTYAPNPPATGAVALPKNYYLTPTSGTTTPQTPLYIWKPIPGANSYWVIVARDPSFTTLVDYGFTQIPAYAPRRTIADEDTAYYWAILPAANSDGTGLPTDPNTGRPVDPLGAAAAFFQKRSAPPVLLSPTNGEVLTATQPTFKWTAVPGSSDWVLGARNYRLQVSTDPNFSTLLDNIVTSSTAYVSTTTYPAQATLYWRVQANDGDGLALTWSNTGTFKQVLPAPIGLTQLAANGDLRPAWSWAAVTGAIGYDVRVVSPGGSVHVYQHVPTPAMVPTALKGTGVFTWQVRADFSGGAVGPYSGTVSFQRSVAPPAQTRVAVSRHALLLSWQGRPGLEEYVVQISTTPDFSHSVEKDKTQGTVVASNLKPFLKKGGRFYWRVAAVDADGNVGGYSPRKTFKIHRVRVG
jgi:hypothetical protein